MTGLDTLSMGDRGDQDKIDSPKSQVRRGGTSWDLVILEAIHTTLMN